jgi:acetyltransferase-like isoleucine patch superfamily enzyme
MRKITPAQIAVFLSLALLAALLGIGLTLLTIGRLPLGAYRPLAVVLAAVVAIDLFAILLYRLFMAFRPLPAGDIPPGSAQEFTYHVHVLFYLMCFYPVIRSGVLPAPLMRLYDQALGARLGDNTYSQGIIHDGIFVTIGSNSTVGQSALLIPHQIEGSKLSHWPIRVGDGVTIGAGAVVLAGVTIGDGALVAAGAVVPKGTQIGAGEVWGGVPAKRLRPRG